MKNNYTPKKINTLFVLEIVVSILGIIATISYFIYKHIHVITDFELLHFALYTFLVGFTLMVITAFTKSVFLFLLGLVPLFFSFLFLANGFTIEYSFAGINEIYFSLFLIVLFIMVIIFAFIFKRKKLLALENERREKAIALENERREKAIALENEQRKKLLALEINQCFYECEKDYNLSNLMAHCSMISKDIKLYENLPINTNEKESIAKYKNKLLNEKQKYIKKTTLNHYKIICDCIETKQLHLSKKIYSASQNLKDSINQFANQFDEENQKLSSIILEKTNFIINFTEKYIDAYNPDIRYNIDEMKGQDFEKYCANLLLAYGFIDVKVTRGSGDQGVDIIGTYNNLKYAVQCKRYSHKLGNTPIQEVAAGKYYYNCQRALVITNNYFTEGAIELAKANNVELWNRNNLMQLIYYTDNQWNNLLENLKIKFSELNIKENENTIAEESNNNIATESDSKPEQKTKKEKWQCSKCGFEIASDYEYCPFCKYVEKSDYKNKVDK